ncbi:MAG: DNA topoisomerase I [Candidatus Bipolaricaulis sibiricus]|uniref:DNA topoisomerase 1 n=1 Tax=Bipolaricaulis sibiricus TaxID=2501609 RepID=A0A410FT75_BIPS1|nr:MAG: DNA topoisomerase I [Candidatus Bipolaricaulis sibiricus]
MPKDLVIVESPTKARTLSSYLGKEFVVLSSKGHVRDLPAKELGVELNDEFTPKWVVRDRKLLAELRKRAQDAPRIYLATDPDREGEAIAYDLMELLGDGDRYARVLLHEITPQAVREALGHPGPIDLAKVEAQRARRILDRLVGYQISPLLSRVLAGRRFEGLSAGRVQSVALRFICDREIEIQEFVPESYWEVTASFPTEPPFTARLDSRLTARGEVEALVHALAQARFTVDAVEEEEVVRRPSAPFITSTLQQAASSELGFSPRRTMQIAQSLYEGVSIGGEMVGLITYMRTDSVRVADSAIAAARAFVRDTFGPKALSPKPRHFRNRRRAQDAHEAIRPTQVARTPDEVAPHLTPEQRKLYDLIWRRFVATQMADGVWVRRKVSIRAGDQLFRTSSSRMKSPGFSSVLPVAQLEDEDAPLPTALTPGQELPRPEIEVEEHQTEPPKRFTEAGIVRKLEQEGIGRPSTYAQIVSVIQDRGYVVREGSSLRPTLLGHLVTDLLRLYFPETVEAEFTAKMEEDLDRVQEGALGRGELLRSFYRWFSPKLHTVEETLSRGEKPFRALSDVACPSCGAPMEVRVWKGSLYLGCSRYPECRTTKNIPPTAPFRYSADRVELSASLAAVDAAPATSCPKCGTAMVLRHGRYGRYLACPSCRATAPVPSGVPCPQCGEGNLVERFGNRYGTFYACSRYPDCRFRVPGLPIEPCPACGEGVVYDDPRRGQRCSNADCPTRAEESPAPAAKRPKRGTAKKRKS